MNEKIIFSSDYFSNKFGTDLSKDEPPFPTCRLKICHKIF